MFRMQHLHAIAGILAVAAIAVIMHRHFATASTKEGLTSGADGTVSEQLQKTTKGLDGGAELMSGIAHIQKNKSDVQAAVAAYKTFLQNAIAAGVVTLAAKTGEDLNALTDGDSATQKTLTEMAVMKSQLDYVAISESVLGGGLPAVGKTKGGWM